MLLRHTREAFAGAEVRGAMPTGAYGAEILFSGAGRGGRDSLTFELEPEPPHRFVRIDFADPDAAPPAPLGDAEMARELAAFLDELVARDGFSGSVLLAKGEEFDLSFGSDGRFAVAHRRRRVVEERTLGQDRVHFVTEVDVGYAGAGQEEVTLVLRLPKSELAQLEVVPSPQWCEPPLPAADEHGLVRVPLRLSPGGRETVRAGFRFKTSGDVEVPDPW